jgi:hypothetical protein
MGRLLLRVFRYDTGAYQSRVDRGRRGSAFGTLTCHFFQPPPSLAIISLAAGVIELRFTARLIFPVGIAALFQSRLMTTTLATVALTVIAGAADIKDGAASRTPTDSPAYLDWQGGRAFPKAGLDNGHQSWQAMDDWYGGALIGTIRLRPQPMATVGAFFLSPLKDNKPTERKRPHPILGAGRNS